MAEIEFSALKRQGTKQCAADKQALIEKVDQWQRKQNMEKAKANWQFKTKDARIQLKTIPDSLLYQALQAFQAAQAC